MSAIFEDQGKLAEALERSKRVLALREKALGPGDEGIAAALGELGDIENQQSRWDDAIAYYHRALDIAVKAVGPEHPTGAGLRIILADAELRGADVRVVGAECLGPDIASVLELCECLDGVVVVELDAAAVASAHRDVGVVGAYRSRGDLSRPHALRERARMVALVAQRGGEVDAQAGDGRVIGADRLAGDVERAVVVRDRVVPVRLLVLDVAQLAERGRAPLVTGAERHLAESTDALAALERFGELG